MPEVISMSVFKILEVGSRKKEEEEGWKRLLGFKYLMATPACQHTVNSGEERCVKMDLHNPR